MNRTVRFFLVAGILVFAVGAVLILSQRSRSRNALAKYKAELRAKGEKLSAEELGYPRPPESSSNLDLLVSGVNQIATAQFEPGSLALMHFIAAGQAEVAWAKPQIRLNSTGTGKTNATWESFSEQFEMAAKALRHIRDAAQNPPRYFFNDPTNFANRLKAPFVPLRRAAQWLAGDAIIALHGGQQDRARADVHALSQLAQFHREDLTLVSQMIRTAIAGLGLAVTWEALQAQGWNEQNLAALQKDWEAVNLADAFVKGMVGERVWGEAAFAHMRAISPQERVNFVKFGGESSTRRSAEDYFMQFVVMPYWRANSEADEMMYLQQIQNCLDLFRQLQHGTSWLVISQQLKTNRDNFEFALGHRANPVTKFRYLFSAMALPNYVRAPNICVQYETQRRLTVVAIAIKRYRFLNGHPPPDLNALVPQLLSAVPVDLMSAKPMGYKLNPDASFVLYSVGEDSRDDGGDANSSVTNKFDLWSGKDAVWPTAVFETQKLK